MLRVNDYFRAPAIISTRMQIRISVSVIIRRFWSESFGGQQPNPRKWKTTARNYIQCQGKDSLVSLIICDSQYIPARLSDLTSRAPHRNLYMYKIRAVAQHRLAP